ncbi:uncharacterized protein BO97DRAFT_435957 [Aspergillus homomorphus CBS 101889]|uniref:Uncharacterized protein n=1 Tax=Aspergillus homomorphus (strain CBS 101889) TaxID=1450537 RepID=A0A395HUS3_ASPHC|nr:hypothetical protein BO97DRAFT_435957 [Aspergillus homomorphus CBS 101889]RAL10588.1 hypothetical protein BO97DRAFT_435957 [Aspergillus homomorphus CBS 101889]
MVLQTLLGYLSVGLQPIPVGGTAPSRNTTNPRYCAEDIHEVGSWLEFNNSTIIQRYGPIASPPAAIRDEPQFQLHFAELIWPRVRRSLRAAFEQLVPELATQRLSPVTFDEGSAASIIDLFRPDTAFTAVGGSAASSPNLAPGDLKTLAEQREYKQVLAQVNFCMRQHNARYGYILADTELVAVKRLEGSSRLAVSTAVPWTRGGVGVLSVLLALYWILDT